MYETTKDNGVDEIVFSFLNDKSINNYYLLYLINKSEEILSERYILMPFQEKEEPNTKISNR